MKKLYTISVSLTSFICFANAQWNYIGLIGNICTPSISVSYTYSNYSIGSHGSGYNLYRNGILIRQQKGDNVMSSGFVLLKLKAISDSIVFLAIDSKGTFLVDVTADAGKTWKTLSSSFEDIIDILPLNKNMGYVLYQEFGSYLLTIERISDILPNKFLVLNDSINTSESNVNLFDTIYGNAICTGIKEVGFEINNNGQNVNYNINYYSEPITIMEEYNQNNELNIYPNPNDGNFTIEFPNPNNELLQITISDITGKTVFETIITQELYNYTGNKLQSGIYLVTVKGENSFYVIKMVVK